MLNMIIGHIVNWSAMGMGSALKVTEAMAMTKMTPKVCLLLIKSLNTLKMIKVLHLVSVFAHLLSICYTYENKRLIDPNLHNI